MGSASCWCAELPNVLPVKEDAACLCPKCLRAAVAKVVGDCLDCRHSSRAATKGGTTVFRCLKADDDAAFARYPRLPLAGCPGKELR